MTERIFTCGINKMSFDGKTTAEITEVLKMFGGDWKEEKQKEQIIHFKCINCDNIVNISLTNYNKMEKGIYEINKMLTNDITANIDIPDLLDKFVLCCKDRDYVVIDSTLE